MMKLNLCLFCGSGNVKLEELYTEPDVGWQLPIYAVQCFNCDARGPTVKNDKEKAILEWNRWKCQR